MADNWFNNFGDTVGLPGLAAAGYGGYKAATAAGRYGLNAVRGFAGAPLSALAAFTAGLTPQEWSGRDGSFGAGKGEQDLYTRGPDGQMTPTLAGDQLALSQSALPPPPSAPPLPPPTNVGAAPGASPPAAAGPSPQSGGAPGPMAFAPPSAPPQPFTPPQVTGSTPAPSGLGSQLPQPGPGTQPPPNMYNGPGSSSFGAGDQAPGGGTGSLGGAMDLAKFLGGGMSNTDMSKAVQQNKGSLWKLASMFSNKGQSFAPGWTASNDWYNN